MPIPYLHQFKEFLMGTVGLVIVGLAIAAVLSIQFFIIRRRVDQPEPGQ